MPKSVEEIGAQAAFEAIKRTLILAGGTRSPEGIRPREGQRLEFNGARMAINAMEAGLLAMGAACNDPIMRDILTQYGERVGALVVVGEEP